MQHGGGDFLKKDLTRWPTMVHLHVVQQTTSTISSPADARLMFAAQLTESMVRWGWINFIAREIDSHPNGTKASLSKRAGAPDAMTPSHSSLQQTISQTHSCVTLAGWIGSSARRVSVCGVLLSPITNRQQWRGLDGRNIVGRHGP